MNESETRAELIDPNLKACGWGAEEGSKVLREFRISEGKIEPGGNRGKRLVADYVLAHKGIKLAVVEAKSDELGAGEGVAQAKQYAGRLKLETAYSTNGKDIYQICMKTGKEGFVESFLSPEKLWDKTFAHQNEWREKFADVPFEDKSGTWQLRYYQEIAVIKTLEALAGGSERILLTLATGTGKTAIAFQIAWKLYHARWSLQRDGNRRPRILFLADRNILADQAFNAFSAFPEDALVRIKPGEIKKKGKVPVNGNIFFTIFQTFMSGADGEGKPSPYFDQYPKDYFDFVIVDECHRGGANDESSWRGILEYFSPAAQLGLTATPKRNDNADTYRYFGEPVYTYSLKEGINDGFLTPFKVKRVKTTLDDYRYTRDDVIEEGEIEEGKLYEEKDFNRKIEIEGRERKRVSIFMDEAGQDEKAIIFGRDQDHAALLRDLVNQRAKKDPFYCVRVTANDGEEGERLLREFQDNEKTIPAILTTSQKLSTGVDARNIRNIVLLRPVNSMIEFKQIVGRGTRLFDGKEFFTIYDFVDAYKHFSDPEWDGEPLGPGPKGSYPTSGPDTVPVASEPSEPIPKKQRVKVKLRDGKEREIKHIVSTSFWDEGGNPVPAEDFLKNLFGELPNLFKDEEELRKLWSRPDTRKDLLEKLDRAGFPKNDLLTLQKLTGMEKSDLYDVLEYVFNGVHVPMTREARAKATEEAFLGSLGDKQKEFISFVLNNYVRAGVDELGQEKLPILLQNKYRSLDDAINILGDGETIKNLFVEFQKHLYDQKVA